MSQRVEWLEIRPSPGAPLATGTLACPGCDMPTALAGPVALLAPIACGFCGSAGRVRDFLTLGEPTRPARVVVRVRLPAGAAA